MDKIATLEKTFIKGILGEDDAYFKRRVNEKIVKCLMFNDVFAITSKHDRICPEHI